MMKVSDYKTKKELTAFVKVWLHYCPVGFVLHGEALQFAMDLLATHPAREEKVGCGIRSIFIESIQKNGGSKHFAIRRTDGTRIDFSYHACITQTKSSQKVRFVKACRNAVISQINDYKNPQIVDGMILTSGGVLLPESQVHVDHIYPFSRIVKDYIEMYKPDIESTVFGYVGLTQSVVFADTLESDRFYDFHQRTAKLQILSIEDNALKSDKV